MSAIPATPYVLPPNVPRTFYSGGGHIGRFRARAGYPDVPAGPEDWIGSVVARWGGGDAGLSRLPDGTSLRDALGEVRPPLVKLLDPGQRLPVHVHPDDSFAAERMHLPNGKAEAWVVLAAGDEAAQLGWRRDVERTEVEDWVRRQDVTGMRQTMNDVQLEPGTVIYVPPGVPHCLPAGCFVLEVQQPADLSILLEWQGFGSEEDAFLGLGAAEAIDAVELLRSDPAALVQTGWLRGVPDQGADDDVVAPVRPTSPFPDVAREHFDVVHLVPGRAYDAALLTVVVLAGAGELLGRFGATPVTAGMTLLVPPEAGDLTLEGDATVVAVTGGRGE